MLFKMLQEMYRMERRMSYYVSVNDEMRNRFLACRLLLASEPDNYMKYAYLGQTLAR